MGDRRSRNDGDCSAVRDGIVAAIPSLRAFAISLSGKLDRADDLFQDTLMRALAISGAMAMRRREFIAALSVAAA
jgi:DNA-directed RNA polymerase specialized sigma24 family protein